MLKKTMNDVEVGFWLPVMGGRREYVQGGGNLAIWMEYDPEFEYFLGQIRLGPVVTCHVQAHRLRDLGDNDPRGRWLIDNEEVDGFISGKGEGDRPSTLEVQGFEGEWVVTVYPYC